MDLNITLNSSTKALGEYEAPLMIRLKKYYEDQGFNAWPHVHLNTAWGSIDTDIDLLLEKNGFIYGVEIKSSHDNLKKALEQTEKMKNWFDYVIVATEKKYPKWWNKKTVGFLKISENGYQVIKEPILQTQKPDRHSLFSIKKDCLLAITGASKYLNKYDILKEHLMDKPAKELRDILKTVILCNPCIPEKCPFKEPTGQLTLFDFIVQKLNRKTET